MIIMYLLGQVLRKVASPAEAEIYAVLGKCFNVANKAKHGYHSSKIFLWYKSRPFYPKMDLNFVIMYDKYLNFCLGTPSKKSKKLRHLP